MGSRWVVVGGLALVLYTATALKSEDQFFDSDGVKIHYTDEGKGEPVVLLHGLTANIDFQWRVPKIIDALKDKYRVIAFDLRGHGKSDKPHDPEKYGTELAEDAIRLLDHLKIDKAHFVGYSLGAFTVGKLRAMHPDRCLSVTLGGAGWARQGDREREEILEKAQASIDAGKGFRPLILALHPPGRPVPSESELVAADQFIQAANDVAAVAEALRSVKKMTVTQEELESNTVPTLAIVGALDPLKVTVDSLQGVMARLEIVVIDDSDHLEAFFRPEFTKSLLDFLAKYPAEAASK